MTGLDLTARTRAALSSAPLSEISPAQRDELLEALAAAEDFEDLPGKWQAAILAAEGALPGGGAGDGPCCHG